MRMKQFSSQEEVDMWRFLLKEIADPVTGVIEKDRIRAKGMTIWEKFRAEVSDLRTATSLRKRFSMPGFPTPQSVGFNLEEQAKLHYALSIPVDEDQLIEFSRIADVDLDERFCIIKYKDRRPGGLELRGFTMRRIRKRREEEIDLDYGMKHPRLDFNAFLNNECPRELLSAEVKVEPIDEQGTYGGGLSHDPLRSLVDHVHDSIGLQRQPKGNKEEHRKPEEVDMITCLENMRSLVTEIGSPDLDLIKAKIEDSIAESVDKKIQINKIKMMMEATLAMMGF